MRRHALTAALAATLALASLASASTASAQAAPPVAWKLYSNATFHFTVDTPTPPKEQLLSTPSAQGPLPVLMGMMELGSRGGLLITGMDLSGVKDLPGADKILDGGIQGALSNTQATLDSQTEVSVPGAEKARDVVAHNASTKFKYRVAYGHKYVVALIGAGEATGEVPSEFSRFAASLKITP